MRDVGVPGVGERLSLELHATDVPGQNAGAGGARTDVQVYWG